MQALVTDLSAVICLSGITQGYGVGGILSGTMLLGLMDWLLEPTSYGLSGLVLAFSLVIFIHGHAPIHLNIAGVI